MLGGLALSLAAARVDAAEARYPLAIPVKPYADALIDLGVQANVSVIGTSACGAGGRAGLSGAYTLDEALARILAGAPCNYRILDPRTVRIQTALPATADEPVRTPTLVAEVLVTAAKRPSSIGTLAASVSVIPYEQIALTGASDVLQTTAQVSGVLTTNLGPGRDKLILRGLSDGAFTGRARSTVGSFLDDAAINYNAPDPDLQLVDVERIEVVRGPQGALYGSGALSGVFRIVTRKPDMTRPAFGLAASAAETRGGSPSQEVEAYANLPLIQDTAALRLVAYRDVQGGYIDNAELRLSNIDRTVREGGRAALRLQPSDAWQIDLSATAQRLRSNDTQYTTPSLGLSRDERLSRVQEGHKNDFAEASATVRGELGWASLRATAAFVDHTFSSVYDASARGPGSVLDAYGADPAALGVYYERTRIRMASADIILRSSRPGPFSWLVGLYSAATLEKSPSALDILPPAGPSERIYTEQRRDRLSESALYGEASYLFAPGWTASLGGRLFQTDVHTQSDVVALPPTGASRSFRNQTEFDGFSPKVSIQRELASGDLVYALFSEGYRAGGFNSGGLQQIRSNRQSFAPDRLRNYEVGLKARLFDARLNLRSAVFFDQWRNIQTDQYRPSGIPYTANVGDADITGFESELDYDFDFGLSLQLNTLFAHSRITRANPDYALEVVDALPTAPRFSGGLVAVYKHPLPRNLTLRLVGETAYVGSSAISFDASKKTRMGEYAQTQLSAQVAGRTWSAILFIVNPGDTAGNTFAYGNPFSFGLGRQSTPQRPRTIGLRLAANY
jgi:outer membrane receptor protein involved in Fe transport